MSRVLDVLEHYEVGKTGEFLDVHAKWQKAQHDYKSGKIDDDEFDKAEAEFKKAKSPFTMLQKSYVR